MQQMTVECTTNRKCVMKPDHDCFYFYYNHYHNCNYYYHN